MSGHKAENNPRSDSVTTASRRRTLPSAVGEPMVWLTGSALVLCLIMIGVLASLVVINGLRTFWPGDIDRLTLKSGEVVMGMRTTEDTKGRYLYRVGNRDIGQESFRWIDGDEIVSIEQPQYAVMLEREQWGVWYGVPEAVAEVGDDGELIRVTEGPQETLEAFEERHPVARARRASGERMRKQALGDINHGIEASRLAVVEAELGVERRATASERLGWVSWSLVFVCVIVSCGLWWVSRGVGVGIGSSGIRRGKLTRFGCVVAIIGGVVGLWVGAPWRETGVRAEQRDAVIAEMESEQAELALAYDEVLGQIRTGEQDDLRERLIVVEPTTGRFSPIAQTQGDQPMMMSQVVRLVPANQLSVTGKFGVFIERWWEFLSTGPREANTEGGVYPVIVGTVLLTLLLTIFVTPLGVIAALYLREYAKQGIATSVIRIAVNNLAGVPSIVYGVFGLGFFCYTVGRYVDTGPADGAVLESGAWWMLFFGGVLMSIVSFGLGLWGKPDPGRSPSLVHRLYSRLSWLGWGVTVVLLVMVVAKTPYFAGFFGARAASGSPTFGGRGLLWASLTLALLTLPVVIVATEEAIAAVPNSMREGSFGCGASKWQTIRRIVLPGALPGILTGAILAMARGAGEVAPLMLVGAVKLNQDLPVSTTAPFLHADRSFMHLGFHIYDLGFQSPDSQAARPMVWTTTLLFLMIVFALNLTAILIRSKLRGRMSGATI
ncbi:MAG: PstA family ABC transporter permease [Phycisphaerales bacterium]